MSETKQVLGYPMLAATMDEVVQLCGTAIAERQPVQIGVLNAAKVVNAGRDQALHAAMLSCDVILADGQAVVWASRMLRQPLPERVAGIDLFIRLLELADRDHLSVYLLGAKAEVVARVAEVMATTYPGARLAGYRDGYFDDEAAVAADIAAAQPDMLFLGMTSPKKEKFLERYQPLMQVPVTHGVGGSFDILAGVTKRAPERWQRAGMEWAYRLLQEPGRMWKRYLRTNVLFSLMVARALLTRRPEPVPTFVSSEAA
ncbi:MAG TPA: WecB/TagA/CpsF family glycosyltransferase [Propionibacteriaceae bacterium]|nr:WecB/TagA/CpsF family glycosyltransferase [Propionibacteriaceae bacterium]